LSIEGQKQEQNNNYMGKAKKSPFSFCFCPTKGKNDILLGSHGAKENFKLRVAKAKCAKTSVAKKIEKFFIIVILIQTYWPEPIAE
jgi:hypothetical protein